MDRQASEQMDKKLTDGGKERPSQDSETKTGRHRCTDTQMIAHKHTERKTTQKDLQTNRKTEESIDQKWDRQMDRTCAGTTK